MSQNLAVLFDVQSYTKATSESALENLDPKLYYVRLENSAQKTNQLPFFFNASEETWHCDSIGRILSMPPWQKLWSSIHGSSLSTKEGKQRNIANGAIFSKIWYVARNDQIELVEN